MSLFGLTLALLVSAYAGDVPVPSKVPAAAKVADKGVVEASPGRQWNGSLAPGDSKLNSGEYYDMYTFEGRAGQAVQIRMTAPVLDPYIGLHFGDQTVLENDDAATGAGALISVTLASTGTYTIVATSYKPGEKGDYTLVLSYDNAAPTPAPAKPPPASAPSGVTRIEGTLSPGDDKISSGEYIDRLSYPCAAGVSVSARVTSTAFDTYIGMELPGQDRKENDDAPSGGGAYLEGITSQSGTCSVFVTSYKPGESGAYVLELSGFDRGAPAASAPPATPSGAADLLGPQLDTVLRSWPTGFKGHLGTEIPSNDMFSIAKGYETDLRLQGATEVQLTIYPNNPTQSVLYAGFGEWADAGQALAAYNTLVARVNAASLPCCSFAAMNADHETLHSTAWLPFDPTGRMGALKDVMIEVELMRHPKFNAAKELVDVWSLYMRVKHTL